MEYEEYEDELDRMQRRRRRKSKQTVKESDDFEFVDPFEENNRTLPRKRLSENKRSAWGKRWKAVIVALVLIVAAATAWNHFTGNGWWTVAVFGLDSRDGNLGKGALSDVEILASINRKSGEIRLLSVFRDSYLLIDGDGTLDKINEAYFLGGREQAVQALETNLDIQVDDYASFNWKAVVDAINILGGVDLEITDSEFAYINSFITETVNSTGVGSYQLEHSGTNHLDGVQAVAYARLRLMDTDFNRTERQRKVLGLVLEKAKQADASTLATVVGTVFPQISTSIGVNDLMTLAKNPKRFYISETSGFPFSHTEMKIGKKSCVIPTTLESNVVRLHEFLYGEEGYSVSGTVKNISSAIADKSGLSEPGKDTESGRNAGASGSSTDVQTAGSSQPQTTQAPQPTAAEAPQDAQPNSAAETDAEPEEETEHAENETLEESDSASETSGDPADATEIAPLPTTTDDTARPAGPSDGPGSVQSPSSEIVGSAAPPGTQDEDGRIHASLEAPGQEGVPETTAYGPGQ